MPTLERAPLALAPQEYPSGSLTKPVPPRPGASAGAVTTASASSASTAEAHPADADYRHAMFGERPPDETILMLTVLYRARPWYLWNVSPTNKVYTPADGVVLFLTQGRSRP